MMTGTVGSDVCYALTALKQYLLPERQTWWTAPNDTIFPSRQTTSRWMPIQSRKSLSFLPCWAFTVMILKLTSSTSLPERGRRRSHRKALASYPLLVKRLPRDPHELDCPREALSREQHHQGEKTRVTRTKAILFSKGNYARFRVRKGGGMIFEPKVLRERKEAMRRLRTL